MLSLKAKLDNLKAVYPSCFSLKIWIQALATLVSTCTNPQGDIYVNLNRFHVFQFQALEAVAFNPGVNLQHPTMAWCGYLPKMRRAASYEGRNLKLKARLECQT